MGSMFDVGVIRAELAVKIDGLEREARLIYTDVMRPRWGGELHGLPQTLYGYMMVCFAWIDLLSQHWGGTAYRGGQTARMVDFMQRYMSADREANNVAVQCWRHALMHTAEPRRLRDRDTGFEYDWLLHWWTELPADQHLAWQHSGGSRKILNLGLLYLIADIRRGLDAYLAELATDTGLQSNYERVESKLKLQPFASL